MISATRSMFASLVGAVILTIGMVFMMPSTVEVHAANNMDGFERISMMVKDQFEQLKGNTNGSLCADNEGLKLIRSSIDKYESVGQRSDSNPQNYHLTTRLIACMISPIPGDGAPGKPGYVVFYGKKLVDAVAKRFVDILSALALLATVLMGIRITLGFATELQSASYILIFKVAFLYLALTSMPTLYEVVINTTNDMSGKIAAAIPTDMCPSVNDNVAAFKTAKGDRTFLLPWVKLDCAVESISVIILDSANSMVGAMVTSFLSSGMGKGLSVAFFSMIMTLLSVLNMALFIVVLANLAIVLMFMIAPLAWVCILFKGTMQYFQKWTTLLIGFAMQPVLLTLFLMMMVACFEQVICKQPFSVVASFNAIKDESAVTDAKAGQPVQINPTSPKHYGKQWCTRAKIQEATKNLLDPAGDSTYGNKIITASPEAQKTSDEGFGKMSGLLHDAIGSVIDVDSLKSLISGEGFTLNQLDVPQIYEKYVKRLSVPFKSMLAAFTVIFILFAFIKELPRFINQLATASVASGNLNQIKTKTMMDKGKKAMDAMTGDFSGGALGQFGSMREGMMQRTRNMPGFGSGDKGGGE